MSMLISIHITLGNKLINSHHDSQSITDKIHIYKLLKAYNIIYNLIGILIFDFSTLQYKNKTNI